MKRFLPFCCAPAAPETRSRTPFTSRLSSLSRILPPGLRLALVLTGLPTAARAQYSVTFDDASKVSYASDAITLGGLNWNMTDALIGADGNDFKNGAKSARLRGYDTSSMTMLEDKTTGLGTLSFQYRQYGNDPQIDWIVEYSANAGGVWHPAGRFRAGAEAMTFSAEINVSGDVRIRIRTNAFGTSNKRVNIDDITLTDYVTCAKSEPPAHEPQFGLAAGTYLDSQTLFFSNFDTFDAGVVVRYTLDGSQPTSNSLLYPHKTGISLDSGSGLITVTATTFHDGEPLHSASRNFFFPPGVADIEALPSPPTGGNLNTAGTFHIRDRIAIRAGTAGNPERIIRSTITGSKRSEIFVVNSKALNQQAKTGRTTISNPENAFSGTWRVLSSELVFSTPGSVGPSAKVWMEKPEAVLRIQYDWRDLGGTLKVEGGTIHVDDHHWTLCDLILGDMYMAPGTYSVADLNERGVARFVGTRGTITVHP
jgi:hypothetical protein